MYIMVVSIFFEFLNSRQIYFSVKREEARPVVEVVQILSDNEWEDETNDVYLVEGTYKKENINNLLEAFSFDIEKKEDDKTKVEFFGKNGQILSINKENSYLHYQNYFLRSKAEFFETKDEIAFEDVQTVSEQLIEKIDLLKQQKLDVISVDKYNAGCKEEEYKISFRNKNRLEVLDKIDGEDLSIIFNKYGQVIELTYLGGEITKVDRFFECKNEKELIECLKVGNDVIFEGEYPSKMNLSVVNLTIQYRYYELYDGSKYLIPYIKCEAIDCSSKQEVVVFLPALKEKYLL